MIDFKRVKGVSTILLAAAIILSTGSAQGQSGNDEWGRSNNSTNSSTNPNSDRASGDSQDGYGYKGPYAQFGVSVGQIDFDGRGGGSLDNNASGGFTLTGGYRFLPWISGEANFTYMGGGSVEIGSMDIGNGSYFAFTFGPKLYPLGAFRVDEIPDNIQPYGLIQIGGGQFEIENTGFEEGAFVARFILGIDVWVDEHIGFFVEGGGHASSENDVDGVGVFTVGGQYRF